MEIKQELESSTATGDETVPANIKQEPKIKWESEFLSMGCKGLKKEVECKCKLKVEIKQEPQLPISEPTAESVDQNIHVKAERTSLFGAGKN